MTLFSRVIGHWYEGRVWMFIFLLLGLMSPFFSVAVFSSEFWQTTPGQDVLYVLVLWIIFSICLFFSLVKPIYLFVRNQRWIREYAKDELEDDVSFLTGELIKAVEKEAKLDFPAKLLLRAAQKYVGQRILFDKWLRKANVLTSNACKTMGFEGSVEIWPDYPGEIEKLYLIVKIGDKEQEKFERIIS